MRTFEPCTLDLPLACACGRLILHELPSREAGGVGSRNVAPDRTRAVKAECAGGEEERHRAECASGLRAVPSARSPVGFKLAAVSLAKQAPF